MNHGSFVSEGVLYQDEAGLEEAQLLGVVGRVREVVRGLRGWRQGAVRGRPRVALVTGWAGEPRRWGCYHPPSDTLQLRAVPRLLACPAASFEYVVTHELAHRYEAFHRLPVDFGRSMWLTTAYSRTRDEWGSEAFAELFTVTQRGLWNPAWNSELPDRFEALMGG